MEITVDEKDMSTVEMTKTREQLKLILEEQKREYFTLEEQDYLVPIPTQPDVR